MQKAHLEPLIKYCSGPIVPGRQADSQDAGRVVGGRQLPRVDTDTSINCQVAYPEAQSALAHRTADQTYIITPLIKGRKYNGVH